MTVLTSDFLHTSVPLETGIDGRMALKCILRK